MNDLHTTLYKAQALAAAAITDNTAQVCTVIDNKGYDALEYIINIGVLADADATFAVLLEDSADNITFTPVSDSFLLGSEALASFTFADDSQIKSLGYNGSARYTKLTITPANNTGSAIFGVIAIQGSPIHAPVVNN